MARFKKKATFKKKVTPKAITKTIIVNVYEKDGKIDEVTTGGFLGVIPMNLEFGPNAFAAGIGKFRGKEYPVEVYVNGLGVVPPQREYRGNHDVETSVMVDATPYVDADILQNLNVDLVAALHSIPTGVIQAEVIGYLTDPNLYDENGKIVGRKPWTPWLSAMQQAYQALQLPKYKSEPIYVEIEGRKAIGCDIVVDVNGARFLFGEGGFVRCADRKLYQFWCEAAVGVFPDGDIYYPAE